MNLAFAQINAAKMNLAQKDVTGVNALNAGGADMASDNADIRKFAANLSRQLNKHVDQGPAVERNLASVKEKLLERIDNGEGYGFLADLKSAFLNFSDGDLDAVSLDKQGLDSLKNLLISSGFDAKDVTEFISGLTEQAGTEAISLGEFMAGLFDLPMADENQDMIGDGNFLETSAVPFLETMLTSLGIEQDDISDVFSQASWGESGVSLESLIGNLQDIEDAAVASQAQFRTNPEGAENFGLQMALVGLDVPEKTASGISLTDLIASLNVLNREMTAEAETIGKRTPMSLNSGSDPYGVTNPSLSGTTDQSQKIATANPSDLLDTLFKGFVQKKSSSVETGAVNSDKTGQSNNLVTFSKEEISTQFQSRIVTGSSPGDASVDGKFSGRGENTGQSNNIGQGNNTGMLNPAATGKAGDDAPIVKKNDPAYREFAPLAGRETGAAPAGNARANEGESFTTHTRSEVSNISETVQVSVSDAKRSDLGTSAAGAKETNLFKGLPAHVTQQVSRGITRAVNQGENTLRIQLKPPELGRLMVTIDNVGNSMKVSIITENQSAKEILASNVNELKSVLTSSGISLDQFDVDMNSDFRQSMTDARNQAGQFNRRRRNSSTKESEEELTKDVTTDPLALMDSLENDGSMHFVA